MDLVGEDRWCWCAGCPFVPDSCIGVGGWREREREREMEYHARDLLLADEHGGLVRARRLDGVPFRDIHDGRPFDT